MPEYQPVSSAHIAAIAPSCCPDCRQNRMVFSKLETGPSGSDRFTFECQKSGRAKTAVITRDPMKYARCRLVGELRPPARMQAADSPYFELKHLVVSTHN